ncbi:MAG: DNA-formamidopyrimidine glycosylase family protein [Gaiellaceae bacterium]
MPEGDALHRAARSLQVLVGQELAVETPHPRAAVKQLAPRLDGRRLESVEAIGKNLLFRFEGGLVLRSHLRMSGRWRVLGRDAPVLGTPWLVLRGAEHAGVLWGGPVLELDRGVALRLGPDILAEPPEYDAMVRRIRGHPDRQIGDALLDQRLVSGIGNIWKVESLWTRRISPWRRVRDVSDEEVRAVLATAHEVMRARVEGVRYRASVYRRTGYMCLRCGTAIKAWPQGDDARMTYWCPQCQKGEEPATA